MVDLKSKIEDKAKEALVQLYEMRVEAIELQQTRKEFEGDFTIVVFPFLRVSKKDPKQTAEELGNYLQENVDEISSYNVVKGFLNLVVSADYWLTRLANICKTENYGTAPQGSETVLVEYSSPNTNKPLHLGHVRNNLLGYSVAELLKAAGKKVVKVQIINDRGIHICKSMVAWQKFGKGETPEDAGLKGDKLVGKYYVEFDKAYKAEVAELINSGKDEKVAKEEAPIMAEARSMLQKWEENDPETIALWKKMNSWVYKGFEQTYLKMGVDFDKYYYESETYLLGKKVVEEGLAKEVFERDEDGSVWIDLTDEGMDRKLLLRSDGTSVYMTQDIGTAIQRSNDFDIDGMIYTVGNEQDYHFKVLFLILKKLGYDWAKNLYHLSYGMVDLPSGKMKSREGTVVDADDLIYQMEATAQKISEELGKTEGMNEEEKQALYHMVGLGALKYFILKVDPKKRMMFNPEESIDFHGNTGPFIQYTHARIKSLLRRGREMGASNGVNWMAYKDPETSEKELIKCLALFPQMVLTAANEHSPAIIGNYVYELVKYYNVFYQQVPVLTDENKTAVAFRLNLSQASADVIKTSMRLLGIDVPERM